MLRHYGSAQIWAQIVFDVGISLSLLYVLGLLRNNHFNTPYQILAMVAGMLMVIVYQWLGIYLHLRTGGLLNEARSLLKAWVTVLFVLSVIGFVTKTNTIYSREVLLKWSVLGYLGQLAFHMVLRFSLRLVRSRGHNLRRALLVGGGAQMQAFADRLARNPWIGIEVVGFVDSERRAGPAEGSARNTVPHLGPLGAVADVVKKHRVNLVYLTVPLARSAEIEGIVRDLMGLHVDLHWVPDMSAFELLNHSVREIEGQPILCLSDSPIDGLGRLGKWLEDKALALAILLIASPVMLAIALLVKLTSPGPVFFRQKRAGLNGRVIEIWKFRTMYEHDEPEGHLTQAAPSDARITPIGQFLRRTSLDEFPQFFNVLGGSMSIVGPRPHALEHNGYYEKQIDAYMLRHRIKPGITGWAQVNGLRGQTDHLEKMQNRVKYDLYYINNWTLGFDFVIIAMTAWAVLTGRNAY
jgi:putative colanic acid biosynthesis UDP-glucose lipid carrier transferase